ncbi:MAG TPA: TetR/AcrR family transcriptional regulator [Candidatus Anaerofilum excrementigallinarum]|nr:TetR/AcrR family transcriptional regulator [Candidatus Anaerofilum excrementigallinarum]
MAGKLEQQKQEKKQSLLTAARELFIENGVAKTSIDQIASRAQVAKGTFYLYFRDKEDLLQALIYRISCHVLDEAYRVMDSRRTEDFTENVILFADAIIEYFKHNRLQLRLIERNFSWPLVTKQMSERTDEIWQALIRDLQASPLARTYTDDEMFKLIFVIMEMCGSVCYSSIIEEKPDTIDNMKPVLYGIIRRALA